MNRTSILVWAAIAGSGLLGGCTERGEFPVATHVVLISIDCLNQRQLATAIRDGDTPAMAALQAESLAFSRAYTHAPWTTPSHMSMMTGLYPSQHGHTLPYREMLATAGSFEIEPKGRNLPERLADAGYQTVAFVGQGPISARYGLARGFERFEESAKNRDESDMGRTLERFHDWLTGGGERPFFLFLHTFDLHEPRSPTRTSDAAALAYIDRRIGEVVGALRENGLYDDTLIILTGDHGSEMIRNDDKCCIHGAGHYEENLKVPLLVKLPNASQAGPRDAIARHVDLLPTVAEVIGLELDGYGGPGASLLNAAPEETGKRISFSEADARCAMRFALVSERYKYIATPRTAEQQRWVTDSGFRDKYCIGPCNALPRAEEFYDLDADPFEERDLLLGDLSRDQANELRSMRAAFTRHRRLPARFDRRETVPAERASDDDAMLRDSLRKLGYAE